MLRSLIPPLCSRRHVWLLAFALCGLVSATESAPVSFRREIAPILQQKCVACHGPDKTKGGFQLHTFAVLMKGGESKAPSVTSGQPARSKLLELIATQDADDRMPQKDDPLTPTQIALIERWIQEGAAFDGSDPNLALSALIPAAPLPEPPSAYPRPVPVLALAFSPDGGELAVGGYHEITLWNPTDGKLLRRLKSVAQRTYSLAYSPDGQWLAAASGTPGRLGEVKLFEVRTGSVRHTLATTADSMLAVCFSSDGARLAAGGCDNAIRIFDTASGRQQRLIEQHADWVMGLAFSPDGAQLASASRDKSARLFDTKTGELEVSYLGHGDAVFAVAFREDGHHLCSAGRDREVHLWQSKDAKKNSEIGGFGGEIYQLALHGNELFSTTADKTVRQHRLTEKKAELVRAYTGHRDFVQALALHPASRRLASGSFDGEVRLWNTTDGQPLLTFLAAPGFQAAQK